MAQIRLENIKKNFGDFVAVENTNMTIEDGEFFVLLGSSGCGKTTTLRMIAGLEMPTEGKMMLDNENVTHLRPALRDIAFVFQLFALYPHMNVYKNLAFPLKARGVPTAEIKKKVNDVASLLRIDHLLHASIKGLSGGDRQRVALGRAIIRRPKAFLMDEPIGTLDAEFRELMRTELRGLHDRIDATTVYVTHDQIEAMSMGDRISVMSHGKVLQVAPPMEIYNKPKTMFVAEFIGSPAINFLQFQGPVAPGDNQVKVNGTLIDIPRLHEGLEHSEGVIGARPEHIGISDRNGLPGKVFGVEDMGARKLVTVDTHVGRIRVMAPNTTPVRVEDNVHLTFKTEAMILFDAKTENALKSELIKETANG